MRSRRRNDYPALILLRLVGIVDQCEAELFGVEGDGFVVVSYNQSDMGDAVLHLPSPVEKRCTSALVITATQPD